MAEVLLGVSGGIAAYKAIDVLRILQRRGHGVTVVMTHAATRFVGPATFAALSGRTVGVAMFGRDERPNYEHLDLARAADILAIVPASANTIARCAAGLGDGLLSAVHLAFDGPVLMAPAMNTRMYLHPATEHNLGVLRARGVHMVEPGSGLLADGEVGVGRLAEPVVIADAIDEVLRGSGTLSGLRVLISAGGTREPLDPVRYLGNRSSGRMGWAVAEAARRRGAEVTVLAANVDLPRHPDIRYVDAPTAADQQAAAPEHYPGGRRGRRLPARRDASRQDRQERPRGHGTGPGGHRGHPRRPRLPPHRRAGDRRLRRGARPGGPRARPRETRPQGHRPHRPQ
jgi:phosphopantothenoylcysteine decarboxylase/phosphopantothenate--cysteine ligase